MPDKGNIPKLSVIADSSVTACFVHTEQCCAAIAQHACLSWFRSLHHQCDLDDFEEKRAGREAHLCDTAC